MTQARIQNPALIVPGALDALQQLGASAKHAGIPEATLAMVTLRASQINGCSVCVDIHTRELAYMGETSERINLVAAWREIGVQATQELLSTKDWQTALEAGHFAAAIDLAADYFDDPTIQLARYVSRDLSPINHSGSTDRFLDALYVGQALSTDPQQRAKIVRDFERHALSAAYTVPLLWWNRIVVTADKFKGWNMSPSQYIGQDLADVWLEE